MQLSRGREEHGGILHATHSVAATSDLLKQHHQKMLLSFLPQAGAHLHIQKVTLQNGISNVAVGLELQGKLQSNIAIGQPILFTNGGKTSALKDIDLKDGALLIKTQTSVYRVASSSVHYKTIDLLRLNAELQPYSTQRVLQELPEEFVHEEYIGGYHFLFTARSAGKVLALVETKPGIFRPRAFRYSTSDSQWKALPAYRGSAYSKGREGTPGHHYVQDAKLDERLLCCIQGLPEKLANHVSLRAFLPDISHKAEGHGQFLEDDTFGQEQTLKLFHDPQWRDFQKKAQHIFAWYEQLNFFWGAGSKSFVRYTSMGEEGEFYRTLRSFSESFRLSDEIESAYKKLMRAYEMLHLTVPEAVLRNTNLSSPSLDFFADEYRKFFGMFFHKLFKHLSFPPGFLPDYSHAPLDVYRVNGVRRRRYKVVSQYGDAVIWTVADDEYGNRWIDDVAEDGAEMTSYGTRKNLYNMGIIVYKPKDYRDQTSAVLESDLRSDGDLYVNMNRLWRQLKPLRWE